MNWTFLRAFGLYFSAALMVCGASAAVGFVIADGVADMAAGHFRLGLSQVLATAAVTVAVVWSWIKTQHLIPDDDEP